MFRLFWLLALMAFGSVIFALGCGGPQVSGGSDPGDDARHADAGAANTRWGQDDIETGLAPLGPALVACYQTAVSVNHHESGSVNISAAIAADGHVDSATPVASTLSKDLSACLANVVHTAKFRAPGFDGVRVRIPLTFEQADAGTP